MLGDFFSPQCTIYCWEKVALCRLKKLVSYSSDARHGPIILLYYIPITGCSNHYCWLYQPLWLRVPLFIIHDTPIISGYIPSLLVIHYQKPLVWGCPYLSSMISLLLMVISHYCWLLGVAVTFAITLHTSHFALHSPHFTLPHFPLLPSHSKPHTSHFTLRASHSKLKLHTPHFYCFLHTSHFTLHSWRPTLHTALNLSATKKH